MVLGFILQVLGTLFAVFAGDFVRQVKKCSRALVFVANLQELPLQKHANRTVRPLKIDEELMPQSVFRHVLKTCSFLLQKLILWALNWYAD